MTSELDNSKVLTRSELQGLYGLGGIETVHVVTGCEGVTLSAIIGGKKIAQRMPEGNYILVRIVDKPTTRRGVYAVRSPERTEDEPRNSDDSPRA